MAEKDDEDSYLDLPVWANRYPRWGTVHGRHHIPSLGTLYHRKPWYSGKVRVRYLPAGQTQWLTFTTDARTLGEIITSANLAEARTLLSLCLTDAHP